MSHRRKPASEITPEYEDSGLFKSKVGQLAVELVPQMSRNSRNDLVVRGFANRTTEIEVAFAGRRVKEAGPLEARLNALMNKRIREAKALGEKAPDIDHVRLPVLIEGAWRPRFRRDQTGWETRSYYLFAARWSILDNEGNSVSFGSPPLVVMSGQPKSDAPKQSGMQ
ncbi:hypothetical protein ROLI_009840 [Roseobacter fucihabitans]|uniref:Uncharacterized protein n=1 Tax=Roseobacter fucihabitans TaxID=1537242 RepID=A0ABZ2BR24_9RHOB|nr:hypothetical protein [Roseobacter litoralis]MBC6967919.1 hypothetical protein [Roseobacter litoralis]